MTPLRLGFLVSGVLHVAVVAAFSLHGQTEIPVVDESRPLTLQVAMFKPPQAAVPQPVPSEPEPPPPVEPPAPAPPAPVVKKPEEPPSLPPVVEQMRPRPPLAPSKPRPMVKEPTKSKPVKARKPKTTPAHPRPAPSPTVKLAAVVKPQPVTPAVDAQEKQHYLAALAAKINRRKYYPAGSRRRGEEGRVVVRFVVQKNGDLTDLTIVESSGSRRLDAAALKTLRRVTPFRPLPEVLGRDRWPITVPIAFRLKG